MKSQNKIFYILFFMIFMLALFFRLYDVSLRPMHGDEAVNAIKYTELLNSGVYEYNPLEYHGPALYYSTYPVSYLSGKDRPDTLDEKTLRLVTTIFGMGLILTLLLLRTRKKQTALLLSAFLTGISPAFVFFSRYYIHEILLVFFCYATIFFVHRYWECRSIGWLIAAAFAFSLMIGTKETWSILFFSGIAAFILINLSTARNWSSIIKNNQVLIRHTLIAVAFLFLMTIIIFTSFFQNFQSIAGFLESFSAYLDRAGNSVIHDHPWYMYLYWLAGFNRMSGYFWGEGFILILAVIGIISAFWKKGGNSDNQLYKFMAYFSFITLVIFSLIPYKTPWNLLTFYFGFIFMAGIGVQELLRIITSKTIKTTMIIILVTAAAHLCRLSYQFNHVDYENPDNPYVYAHPLKDIYRLVNEFEIIALNSPEKLDTRIDIAVSDSDYWPLPWYLRRFKRVGWWNQIDTTETAAPVIIISPDLEKDLINKLYKLPPAGEKSLYMPLMNAPLQLRPGKELHAYIKKDFRDEINRQSSRGLPDE